MRCEVVPPFSTASFSREVCGDELRCDASLATCADFDLWLRLSDREIVCTDRVLGSTRLGPTSMTRDPSRYVQFCQDKVDALERHFQRRPELAGDRDEAIAGVYCWAAESLLELEGPSAQFSAMVDRAAAVAPRYERVKRAIASSSSSPSDVGTVADFCGDMDRCHVPFRRRPRRTTRLGERPSRWVSRPAACTPSRPAGESTVHCSTASS